MSIGQPDHFPRLLGDIGGTNARFALQFSAGGPIEHIVTLPCEAFPTPLAAIQHYLAQAGGVTPRCGAIGIANPITGDLVKMTNHHWTFSIEALRQALMLDRLLFLNDFTTLAWSLPALKPEELTQVGGGTAIERAPIALLGAGTGLGVSGLVPYPGGYAPLEGEGGHVTLPTFNDREAAIVSLIRREFPHVSAERVLSGVGLPTLYLAIAQLQQVEPETLTPAQITERAISRSCPVCAEVLSTFCAMLGTVAADLALTLGARGGVYIGGGIIPKLGDYFIQSTFRARFEQKGRFEQYLRAIPVYVIHAQYPALTGAARALDSAI
ncbi:glucokinase [Chitinivorax tropicus]|uniref:Glucokinase n=1 Tax=Chitinivorax tropicus TaxID=714531 RepID=A0A840MEJ0_9PROT|nr:glucokinase [Chitinivorax tropicus]MBB5017098.1 glucokinase [Chitinivorax tropicus]